jgi:hypothetical protein
MKLIFDYKEFEEANRGLSQLTVVAELFLLHLVNKVVPHPETRSTRNS